MTQLSNPWYRRYAQGSFARAAALPVLLTRTRRPALVLSLVPALALARPAWGQAATDSPLDQVVQTALENNLALAQQRQDLRRAEAAYTEARGRYLPSLSLDSRYSEQSGLLDLGEFVNPVYGSLNQILGETRFPTDLTVALPLRHESRARIVQPVFNEAIRAGAAASRNLRDGVEARTAGAARTLAAQAQAALLQVGAARSASRIWESTLELVEESERVAQRLVDAGTATPDAVLRARAERSEVEQELHEARRREDAAVRGLNRLLNRPLDTPVEAVPEDALDLPLPLTREEVVAQGLARREELREATSGVNAAGAQVRLANAAFLPSIAVALDYGFQGRELSFGPDDDYWTASVLVSWGLFNGGQDAARRDAAQAGLRQLELRRQEAEEEIRRDIVEAYEAARVARTSIATAQDRLAAARRSFELVRRRYEEGLASPVEFLDARTTLTRSELNRAITLHQYAIRWVDLERAAALRDIRPMEINR